MNHDTVVPYKKEESTKKEQVAEMFDNISPKYDFLNHFLSLGIDILWRKKAIRMLKAHQPEMVLDVATGTGDFAVEALNAGAKKVIGVDISEGMLSFGRKKIKKKGLEDKVELFYGDSENLKFKDEEFDAVIVAFGVRNFQDLRKGLSEIHRVLKKGGILIILEFSKPIKFPLKQLYSLYFTKILPSVGKLISKDNRAYTYLPESVQAFPDRENFTNVLSSLNFSDVEWKSLTFGISSIYKAQK